MPTVAVKPTRVANDRLDGVYEIHDKKLIRRWDSEGELSLRRHRTRTKNTLDSCINSATDQRGYVLERRFNPNQWNNSVQRPLRHSRSFKVTDVGTNRKLICDFLLVI